MYRTFVEKLLTLFLIKNIHWNNVRKFTDQKFCN